jgi:hypothetical protein
LFLCFPYDKFFPVPACDIHAENQREQHAKDKPSAFGTSLILANFSEFTLA